MLKMLKKIGSIGALVILCIASCKSTSPQSGNEFEVQENSADLTSEDPGKNNQDSNEDKLYHPKEASAWFTRKLIQTTPQPTATAITECYERVAAAVKDAPNLRALDEVALSFETTALNNKTTYHWCFYQMMVDLDIKLDNSDAPMTDKTTFFFQRARELWIIARALDSGNSDSKYMTYLRTRYMEINQSKFGRKLETMDLESIRTLEPTYSKAAGQFEE